MIGNLLPTSSPAISMTRRCSSDVHEATSVECALTVMADRPCTAATSRRCARKLASSIERSLWNGSSTAGMTPWARSQNGGSCLVSFGSNDGYALRRHGGRRNHLDIKRHLPAFGEVHLRRRVV